MRKLTQKQREEKLSKQVSTFIGVGDERLALHAPSWEKMFVSIEKGDKAISVPIEVLRGMIACVCRCKNEDQMWSGLLKTMERSEKERARKTS